MIFNLRDLASKIYIDSVIRGWWPEDVDLNWKKVLIVSEVCEAVEGVRKDTMDKHLPHLKEEHVELADTVIRILELLAYEKRWGQCRVDDLPYYVEKSEFYLDLINHLNGGEFNDALEIIFGYADQNGIALLDIIEQKNNYNKTRTDHTKEEREGKNGKRF